MSTSQATNEPRLLRIENVAAITQLGQRTIYRMVSAGEFPAPLKFGKANRWDRYEIDAWLDARLAAR